MCQTLSYLNIAVPQVDHVVVHRYPVRMRLVGSADRKYFLIQSRHLPSSLPHLKFVNWGRIWPRLIFVNLKAFFPKFMAKRAPCASGSTCLGEYRNHLTRTLKCRLCFVQFHFLTLEFRTRVPISLTLSLNKKCVIMIFQEKTTFVRHLTLVRAG